MDSQQALNILEHSPSLAPSKRLRSARVLARHATKADLARILRIREAEHNSWVQKALDKAIRRTEERSSNDVVVEVEEERETNFSRHISEDVYAQATEECSKLFLHELRPLVGILEADANTEINCYASSSTRVSVARIQSFLCAIDMLRYASSAPIIKEFDLTDLVVRVSESESKRVLVASGGSPEEKDGSQSPADYIEQFSNQLA